MEELKKLLDTILNDELQMMILSAPRKKESYLRVRIRPEEHRGTLVFQAACWDGKKEFHTNNTKEEMIQKVLAWMELDYRQLQAETMTQTASVLVSKKGKVTVKTKHRSAPTAKKDLSHNRTKQYLLPEGEPVPFLVKLGVMTPEGKVVKAKYDKFRQINRFLEFIEDICPVLSRNREISMIDFGCGKSYLTFAMYYYLHEKKGFDLRITGLDLKEDVIAHCNALAEEFGYEKLKFLHGDIADYEGTDQVDLVVTLHACDTATDYALAKAVAWNAKAILSVPCCQHELNRQIKNETLEPVLKYGLLKERMAALLTDGLRASMLEQAGYQVQVLEFIDMEHTPKNILIRAVKEPEKIRRADGKRKAAERNVTELSAHEADKKQTLNAGTQTVEQRTTGDRDTREQAALQECMDFLHVHPTLQILLEGQKMVNDDPQVKKSSESKAAEIGNTKNITEASETKTQAADRVQQENENSDASAGADQAADGIQEEEN